MLLPAHSFVHTFPFFQSCSSLSSWDAGPPSTCTPHIQKKLLYPLQVNITVQQQHGQDKLTLTTPAILSPYNVIVGLVGWRAWNEAEDPQERDPKAACGEGKQDLQAADPLCSLCRVAPAVFPTVVCWKWLIGKTGFDGFWCISVGPSMTCSLYKHWVEHVYIFSTLETSSSLVKKIHLFCIPHFFQFFQLTLQVIVSRTIHTHSFAIVTNYFGPRNVCLLRGTSKETVINWDSCCFPLNGDYALDKLIGLKQFNVVNRNPW